MQVETFLEGWASLCLLFAISMTVGTAVTFVCIAVMRIPRGSWIGYIAYPVNAAWSWTVFGAVRLGLGLSETIALAAAASCAVFIGWWRLCRHK